MPCSDGEQGRPCRDHRQVVEAIVYRFRTGIAWRGLPAAFAPWQTTWKRHKRFSVDGTWDKIHARLVADADAAGELDWNLSMDSTINRAHQHTNTLRRTESVGGVAGAARTRSATGYAAARPADAPGLRPHRLPRPQRHQAFLQRPQAMPRTRTRHDKLAVVYRGGVALRSVMTWLRQ